MKRTPLLLFFFLMLACTPPNDPIQQASTPVPDKLVLFVNEKAAANGDGSSWDSAFRDLQYALDQAKTGNEIWVAAGKYVPSKKTGGEGERHKSFSLKVGVSLFGGFSGEETELDQRDWEANEVILSGDLLGDDEEFENNDENCYHVLTGNGTDRSTILDGFIVSGGNANENEFPHDGGGGMTNFEGSPTIRNCTFQFNSAFADGGGIRNWAGSHPLIFECVFLYNKAEQEGGGLMSGIGSHPTVQNTLFQGNSAGEDGGGMYSNMMSNSRVYNCLFIENQAGLTGAGMYNVNNSQSQVTNCTFYKNEAAKGGGAISNKDSHPTISNCILWENKAPDGPEVYNDQSEPIIRFSVVAGGYPGEGNLELNPYFADQSLRLTAGSPAIDAGDNSTIPSWLTIDKDGNARISNEKVDLGAYEY